MPAWGNSGAHPPWSGGAPSAADIARFLDDPASLVRREAMLAVGPLPGVVATDDLVYWLHDPDTDVSRVCEAALRGRGLQHEQIKLARLITDRQPNVRLQVLDKLMSADVEPGVWLRRLTHDLSPHYIENVNRAIIAVYDALIAERQAKKAETGKI